MDPANWRHSSRGPSGEESARTSALERRKAIRQSGRSAAGVDFQVKMEEPIYDTIPEEAYASLVAKRREAAKDFIVDDNGLGYGDLGEEEDWENNPAYRGSSSEEDYTDDQRRGSRKKDEPKIRKRRDEQEQSNKRPSSLSAAAALMGKQKLSSMFTSSAFQRNAGKGVADDASIIDQVIAEITPDEADRERRRRRPAKHCRYHGCAPLWLTCPSCSTTFECPAISSFITASVSEKFGSELDKGSDHFWAKLYCPRCPDEDVQSRISPRMIANQVKRQAERFISSYHAGLMICDDELCQYTTRCLNLRVMGDSEKGTICTNYPRCHGHLVRRYTEVDLYKQLSYFCHVLDWSCWEKLEIRSRVRFEKQFARIRQAADLGASSIRKMRDRCAYGWVKIEELAIF